MRRLRVIDIALLITMVPLWLDIQGPTTRARIEEQFGTDFGARNRDHASHMNLFPTVLTLMNVETESIR